MKRPVFNLDSRVPVLIFLVVSSFSMALLVSRVMALTEYIRNSLCKNMARVSGLQIICTHETGDWGWGQRKRTIFLADFYKITFFLQDSF